jgi:WG containing repeat
MVIPASFKSAHPFQEGLARVGLGDGVAFINRRGQVVIPGPFEIAEDFKNGLETRGPERTERGLLNSSGTLSQGHFAGFPFCPFQLLLQATPITHR